MKLTVNLAENSYPIYIENGILADAGSYISQIFNGKICELKIRRR